MWNLKTKHQAHRYREETGGCQRYGEWGEGEQWEAGMGEGESNSKTEKKEIQY